MAELMLLSEIADPTRFFTDNLLGPEDWGAWRAAWRRGGLRKAVPCARREEASPGGGRPRRSPPSEEGGAGAGETAVRDGGAELDRGREGGAGVSRYRFSRARAGGPASGPVRLDAGCAPAPPPPTPRLLQTAPCTPAWTRWPRSRRSSSAARSRMSRYAPGTRPPHAAQPRRSPQPRHLMPPLFSSAAACWTWAWRSAPPSLRGTPCLSFRVRGHCPSTHPAPSIPHLPGASPVRALTPDSSPVCLPPCPSGGPRPRVRGHFLDSRETLLPGYVQTRFLQIFR